MDDALPRPVRSLFDAANAGDTDAFLGGLAPGAVVGDGGREFPGAAEIRVGSDAEFIGAERALEVEEVGLDGTRTIVSATVGGNGFTRPSTLTFVTIGGHVSRMMIRG